MTYDDMLTEADKNNLTTREKSLFAYDSRIKGKHIAINKGLTEQEKIVVYYLHFFMEG